MSASKIQYLKEELSAACFNSRQHNGDVGMKADSDCYCVRCCAVRFLAHQQPSSPTADWDDFPPGGLHASSDFRKAMSATTPDVEKITQNTAHNIDTRLPYGFTNDETDIVEDEVREALAQVEESLRRSREPLVRALEDLAEFCSGRTIDDVRRKARLALGFPRPLK